MPEKAVINWSHQVSLVVFHPRSADEVVLLSPPVTEPPEEVVGEEPVDGVPDYVDIDGLLYPEPGKEEWKIWFRPTNRQRRRIAV